MASDPPLRITEFPDFRHRAAASIVTLGRDSFVKCIVLFIDSGVSDHSLIHFFLMRFFNPPRPSPVSAEMGKDSIPTFPNAICSALKSL